MKLAFLCALALMLAACGSSKDSAPADDDASGTTVDQRDSAAALMATALEELVTKDHTFGAGPPPFTDYLIQSRLDPGAGGGPSGAGPGRALTDDERATIEAAITPLGPVQFIDDPDEWITPDLVPTVEGGVILGVGEPEIDGDRALVPVSLWCSGLCGTWLTYAAELVDGAWQIVGIEGPVAIS